MCPMLELLNLQHVIYSIFVLTASSVPSPNVSLSQESCVVPGSAPTWRAQCAHVGGEGELANIRGVKQVLRKCCLRAGGKLTLE